MRAGKLDQRVCVLRRKAGQDGAGQPNGAWESVGERWASVEPMSARELLLAQQTVATTTHKVRFRFGADVRSQDRLLVLGRGLTLEVEGVIEPELRRAELICTAHLTEPAP